MQSGCDVVTWEQVIIFDPAYDAYNGMCRRAGGIPKVVPLEPETWEVDRPALESAFSSTTKMLLLNSPHNPTGQPTTVLRCTVIQ